MPATRSGSRRHGSLVLLVCHATVGVSRPLRLLPLGDSLTYGCGDQCDPEANCLDPAPYLHHATSKLGKDGLTAIGELGGSHYHPGQSSGYGYVPCSRCSGGYRGYLLNKFFEDGQDITMVGNLENDDGNGRHEGHVGWRIDQLNDNVDFAGGIGLGHNGEGGHPEGSMDGGAGWSRLQPDLILLHAGTNDIGQGADLETVLSRTHQLLSTIFERLPQAQVFAASLISMLPYGPAEPVGHDRILEAFNAALPAMVADFASLGYRIYFVDLATETGLCKRDWELPLGSSGILQECCPGKNHPTNKGYKRIATSFFNALKEQVFDVALAAAEAKTAAANGATGGDASMPAGLGGLG